MPSAQVRAGHLRPFLSWLGRPTSDSVYYTTVVVITFGTLVELLCLPVLGVGCG